MNRSLVFDLATDAFIARHEDALFLGPPGTGKSHLAQAIGHAAIQQGYRVLYRETHTLLDELAEATLDGTRKEHTEFLVTVPPAHPRRSGHAQAAAHRCRRTAGDHHATLRTRQHRANLEPPSGRLGQTAGRRGRRERHARPPAPPWACAQVRPAELAHQDGCAGTIST